MDMAEARHVPVAPSRSARRAGLTIGFSAQMLQLQVLTVFKSTTITQRLPPDDQFLFVLSVAVSDGDHGLLFVFSLVVSLMAILWRFWFYFSCHS
jgi:hypothetical protein